MYSKAVLWTFKELERVYCQSIEGQYWDLYCQPLPLKKWFSQVAIDKLSSCGQAVVGNHLLPLLPAALQQSVCSFICNYEYATKQFRFVSFKSTYRVPPMLWLYPKTE